ncbi:MAG: carboxypeptidase-like regulatory domain-containing protein, partial [Lutimonas sp.]
MKQSYFTQKCKMVGSLSLFFFMFLAFQVHAQTKTITGTVTSEDGSPVPGVNVVQKGTTNGTATDFDGKYTLDLQGGLDILEFSYIGFATQDIKVGNLRSINVTMTEDTQSLDEVVIIGYAPVDREKVLGAMSTVDSKEIVQVTPTNSFEAVQGRLSGVQILSNGGPGAGFDIRIRGIATFSSGTSPLYVVDGQQLTNIDNLDPSDIKTFEVLKDGATAAIYGSRGANGVVLITTKSGSAGGVKIDVTANTAYTTLNGSLPLSNTRQRVLYEDIQRSNQTALTANQRDSLSLLLRNSFDLQKLITRPAVRQQVNIGVSG